MSDPGPDALARFRPWLRHLAGGLLDAGLGGKLDASDLVQQTLLEAVRDGRAFRGTTDGERAGWLRAILTRVAAKQVRAYRGTDARAVGREASVERLVGSALDQSSAQLAALLSDGGPTPSEDAAGREEQVRLAAALAGLPDDYRQVILWRNAGMPHDEIARRLGRTPGAVRMVWVRALAQLRAALEA